MAQPTPAPSSALDFATATADDLANEFPDLGLFGAEDIVDWRTKNGAFPDETTLRTTLGIPAVMASRMAAAAKAADSLAQILIREPPPPLPDSVAALPVSLMSALAPVMPSTPVAKSIPALAAAPPAVGTPVAEKAVPAPGVATPVASPLSPPAAVATTLSEPRKASSIALLAKALRPRLMAMVVAMLVLTNLGMLAGVVVTRIEVRKAQASVAAPSTTADAHTAAAPSAGHGDHAASNAKPEAHAAKPEEHAAKPEEHAAKPEEHTAKPEEHTAKPEEHTAKPEEHAAKPEVHEAKPETHTAKSEAYAVKAEEPAAKREEPAAKPEAPHETPLTAQERVAQERAAKEARVLTALVKRPKRPERGVDAVFSLHDTLELIDLAQPPRPEAAATKPR